MGCGTWTASSWTGYSTARGIDATSTVEELYTSSGMKDDFNPKGVEYRESCDSADHPNSTPIILGLDVTGSMGHALETVCKKLGDTMGEILDRNPVTDPQIMFTAIGDHEYDDAPLQVTQFESDIRIAEQLNDIWFERGGGGNGGESYLLSWYFAARHTKTDNYDKRGKKGFIFTVGDECCLPKLPGSAIKEIFGEDAETVTAEQILAEVSRKYEVYHLIVKPVGYQPVERNWEDLLGKNAVYVENIDNIPEVIVSILELHAGKTVDEVANSWDGSTALIVKNAINDLAVTAQNETALVEF